MTLDDPELIRIFSEFRMISQIWEATTATPMKIDTHYQRQFCSHHMCVLFSDVYRLRWYCWAFVLQSQYIRVTDGRTRYIV